MNHRDHLALTFAFLRKDGFTRGSDAIYEHLAQLDQAENGGMFHATLSTVWPRLMAAHMQPTDDDFDAFLRRERELLDKALPLTFYRRDRLFSQAARMRFIEPDLRDLPRIKIAFDGYNHANSSRGARNRDARE